MKKILALIASVFVVTQSLLAAPTNPLTVTESSTTNWTVLFWNYSRTQSASVRVNASALRVGTNIYFTAPGSITYRGSATITGDNPSDGVGQFTDSLGHTNRVDDLGTSASNYTLSAGVNRFTVRLVTQSFDNLQWVTKDDVTYAVIRDNLGPSFLVSNNSVLKTSPSLELQTTLTVNTIADSSNFSAATGSGTEKIAYSIDGGTYIATTYTSGTSFVLPTLTFKAVGPHTVDIKLTDRVGNETIQTVSGLEVPLFPASTNNTGIYNPGLNLDIIKIPLQIKKENLVGANQIQLLISGTGLPIQLTTSISTASVGADGSVTNPASNLLKILAEADGSLYVDGQIPVSWGGGRKDFEVTLTITRAGLALPEYLVNHLTFPSHPTLFEIKNASGDILSQANPSNSNDVLLTVVSPDAIGSLARLSIWSLKGAVSPASIGSAPGNATVTSFTNNGGSVSSLSFNTLGTLSPIDWVEGDRTIVVKLDDGYGHTWTESKVVRFENITAVTTVAGDITGVQSWIGRIETTGNIVIKNGGTLTIHSNTEVQVKENTAIIIESGGHVIIQDGVKLFSLVNTTWLGIRANGGTITTNGGTEPSITITRAVRGIALLGSSQANINDVHFREGEAGIHTLSLGVVSIDNCIFEDLIYGVKEDSPLLKPQLTNSLFKNTRYAYYDALGAVLTTPEINVSPNAGNSEGNL